MGKELLLLHLHLMHDWKKDSSVYQVKLHVSNISSVFQHLMLLFLFLTQNILPSYHEIFFFPFTVLTLCSICSAGAYLIQRNFWNLLNLDATWNMTYLVQNLSITNSNLTLTCQVTMTELQGTCFSVV